MKRPIAIQGILFDEKSSFQQGPAKAPPLIREALYSDSANMFTESLIDISTLDILDAGDFEIKDYFEIESISTKNLDKGNLLTLGGDHSITYPIIKAHRSTYPKLDILHIDAHGDLYDEFEGDRYSHACPFARIMEEGLANRLVQVGIRTLTTHQKEQAKKFGVEVIEMKGWDIHKLPSFSNPLYLSLDMDAFDPAFAPGISHYEPGGFSSRQVMDIVQNLKASVIGADIVEYNPDKDINGMTAYLAAKMMKEILARMIETN